jgi:peptidyl-prolyl cis-trans isomerase SurA
MNKLISIILFCCLSNLLIGQSKPLILNKVVATVGSEYILYTEVQELYSYAKSQNKEYGVQMQCEIMEQLVGKALLLDQAKLDSIEVSPIEVEVEVQKRLDYILSQMGGDEDRFFDYYGKTPLEQKEIMKEPLKEDLIQQRIQGTLIRDVAITPKEVIAFFKQIPEDSLPFLNAEVELGEISMPTMISEKNKSAAKEKLEKIKNRIVVDGEKFEELASIFSDDLGSARTGGDLGWAKRGSYVPEFEAAAYNLEEGEISDIVESKFGYHLLQLMGRRGNTINVRHILIKPEVTEEDITRTKEVLDSVAVAVRVDTIKFDYAVRLYSDKETQSYNNAGRMINPETGDTFWETGQLPYQIYFAIESLEVGGVSEILEFEERGEKIFKIIQLQSKSRPHRASLDTDYSKIEEFAKESKKNEYFNTWMDNKIKNTHILINDSFKTCPNLDKYYAQEN